MGFGGPVLRADWWVHRGHVGSGPNVPGRGATWERVQTCRAEYTVIPALASYGSELYEIGLIRLRVAYALLIRLTR